MKVLISGCARSGTTLMVHLMRYFYSCNVIIDDEKHPLDYTDYNSKDHVLVIKKPFHTKESIEYFSLDLLIKYGWRIIWMIRDGRDVIVSQNHHVNPKRWISTNYEMLKTLPSEQILPIRYESLCSDPRKQMLRISSFIGQKFQKGFEQFYENMEDSPMNSGIMPRPIDKNSIGAHAKEPEYVKASLNKDFTKLLTILGYE